MNPGYPVYVISKGRWESRLTIKALDKMRVPHNVIVEPQEAEQYAQVVGLHSTLLTLPFSNLGLGSIPARNWVWEHAISTGAERHWILDDNIRDFYRLNRNLLIRVASGTIFKCAEDFVDRYENVALAGFQYESFIPRKSAMPPFRLNTRIYSIILVNNYLPFRWRGRYNEDTDLSLRALKAGWCTVLFNAFAADKMKPMTMKGGNSDELYKDDGRLKMAQSLAEQHPDVARVVWKYTGRPRWHHQVDYRPFKNNKLVRKPGVVIPQGVNNYGMRLEKVHE